MAAYLTPARPGRAPICRPGSGLWGVGVPDKAALIAAQAGLAARPPALGGTSDRSRGRPTDARGRRGAGPLPRARAGDFLLRTSRTSLALGRLLARCRGPGCRGAELGQEAKRKSLLRLWKSNEFPASDTGGTR
ncbi:hypothetical protein AAY473_021365 [Plecturocebus cupreus]